jgi:hypothetical protein
MRLTPRLLALSLLLLSACNHAAPQQAATTTTAGQAATEQFSGTAHISGTLASFAAPSALTDPIATPFTITVAEPGRGGFAISGAIVDGRSDTIVWSGGRPLPVTGACHLDVGDAPISVTGTTATFGLDDGVRALTAGDCAFGSSVAVGSGGLAESQPSVRFRLPRDTTFKPTGNSAVAVSPIGHFEGHHGSATTSGTFTVTTARGDTWQASKVALDSGTWILDITRTATNALHVEAQFDGGLTIQRA